MGETMDRKAFETWLDGRTAAEACDLLGTNYSWLSRWRNHSAEIQDRDIHHWEEVTGISRDVWLAGRLESNTRFLDQ
jgi:hypothetical protein